MIEVNEAEDILLRNIGEFGTESVLLSESLGRVLDEDWFADRDMPPYHRVTMDGIAIRFEDFAAGILSFKIDGIAAAGMARKQLNEDPSHCLEVMTGSILPKQADTVIRYEDLEIANGTATIKVASVKEQQNVHFKGEDRKAGVLVVHRKTVISPAEIGVGASIGKSNVQVVKLPKIMVISTGDELVEINQQPLEHQIRRSNVYRLSTTLNSLGIQPKQDHLIDNKAAIAKKLSGYLKDYDVIILSGGVSKGKFDFLPLVLNELGVTQLFHKIKQRPGKPFWFGKYKDHCTVFAFPGNPVSSFLCMQRYFKKWLQASLHLPFNTLPHAVLQEDVLFKPELTYFLEVRINYGTNGSIQAWPQKGNGSGDLANLTSADAFIELPVGRSLFTAGEAFPIYKFR